MTAAATETSKSAKEQSLTQKQIDEMIQKGIAEAVSKMTMPQIVVQAHNDIDEDEGVTVPPGYVPKDKTLRVTKMNDGTLELKRISQKKNFNARERDAVIDAIVKSFEELTREVAGQEKPKPPTKLFVNQRFRDLFQNQYRWADSADIIIVPDGEVKDFKEVKKSEVRFQFSK